MKAIKIISLASILLFVFSCKSNPDKIETKSADGKEVKSNLEPANQAKLDYAKFYIDPELSLGELDIIKVGDIAPDFSATDQNGNAISLEALKEQGEVVVIFYRGYWCPLCIKHLKTFNGRLEEVAAKGAQIVIVAPEGETYRDTSAMKTGLEVPFISDANSNIMSAYGVAYNPTEEYQGKFVGWIGKALSDINNDDQGLLPVPATYIIGKDGRVKWKHFDINYKNRASIDEILAQL